MGKLKKTKTERPKKTEPVCLECKKEFAERKEIPRNKERYCNECLTKEINYGDWSLNDEREFYENLYVGRFNFFLLVFSLFVSAGFANSFKELRYLVFYFGAFLLVLCWLTLLRIIRKFNIIMQLLFNRKGEILYILQKMAKNDGYKGRIVISKLMGIYIPIVCILFLITMGLLIQLGIMK